MSAPHIILDSLPSLCQQLSLLHSRLDRSSPERVTGNLFLSGEIYFSGINNPSGNLPEL